MKKILTLVLTIFLGISLSSCESFATKFRRIDAVAPEVDYGYISISSAALSKNFEHLRFQETTSKMLKKSFHQVSYPYSTVMTDEYIYFLVEYNNRDGNFFQLNAPDNKHEFDIALFRVDIYEAVVEKIYDFKKVIPNGKYNYTMPNIYYLLDDERAVFKYNGKIEVFNPQTQELLSTRDIHDKEAYRNEMNNPYVTTEYGDVYAIINNTLFFYELNDDAFVKKQFIAAGSSYVERFDDYLLLSSFTTTRVYQYAYLLSTGESTSLEDALAYKENYLAEKTTHEHDYDFLLNDIEYDYEDMINGFVFSEHNGDQTYTINSEYMIEHSAAYRELGPLWNPNSEEHFNPQYFFVDAGKLFIIFGQTGIGRQTVGFIYEYDIANDMIYYVGYHYNIGINRIIPIYS
jgi:hypothetical protein